jgi:hypothetical protein
MGPSSRNGLNITSDMLASAVVSLYNIDPSFANTLASQGVQGVAAKGAASISLADLNKHDVAEHDASLVRNDIVQGDNHSVQPALLAALLADAAGGPLSISSLAKSRARREAESKKAGSPALSAKASTLAYGEAALLLQALGSPPAGSSASYSAPVKWVEEWMGQEKLPTGYVKPAKAITSSGTTLLAAEILALAKTLGDSTLLTGAPKSS